MLVVGGNLIAKSSFLLQSRLVLLPWLKKNCSVRCTKVRQYGSPMPVRYVPKKFRETETPESFSQSPKKSPKSRGKEKPENSPWSATPNYDKYGSSGSNSVKSEPQRRLSDHKLKSFNNIHTDEQPEMDYDMGSMDSHFLEELKEVEEDLEFHNLSAEGEQRLRASKAKIDAEKVAVDLLAARAYTAMELRKKLQVKRVPPDIIDGVLCDLQERGLLNDSLYAEAYSRSRWSSSYWGPRRIKQALFKKGVNQVDAENALKLVFEDDEDGDQHLRLGISKSSLDQLYMQASKQWLKSQDAPRDTRKGRMIRWLQYRGFNWGIVSVILKKLESQFPP